MLTRGPPFGTLEGGENFKRWNLMGHWWCTLQGKCKELVFFPVFFLFLAIRYLGGINYMLIILSSLASDLQTTRSSDHGQKHPKTWGKST